MGEGFQFIDIIFLAMLAAFIALRLRSVLGRRTGNERRPDEKTQRRFGDDAPGDGKVADVAHPVNGAAVEVPDYRFILSPASPAFDGIEEIRRADRNFSLEQFAAGARGAYELVLTSFWNGDRDEFRPFVSDEVFAQFDAVISARTAAGQSLKNHLEHVSHLEIVEAKLKGSLAEITVQFTSDFILMTIDGEGRVVDGNPVDTVEAKDIWTFSRDLSSADPNWTLIVTRSGDA